MNLSDVASMAWDVAIESMIYLRNTRKRGMQCVSKTKIRYVLLNIEKGNLNVLKKAILNPQTQNPGESRKMEAKFTNTVRKIATYNSEMEKESMFDTYFSKFVKYVLWDIEDLETSFRGKEDTEHFRLLMKAEGIPTRDMDKLLTKIGSLKKEVLENARNSGYERNKKRWKGGR